MVGPFECRQNATQRRRVKECGNTNYVAAGVDDFNGNAKAQGHRHRQEGRSLRVSASGPLPIQRDCALPRLVAD